MQKHEKKLTKKASMRKSLDKEFKVSTKIREKEFERRKSVDGIINRQLRSEIEHRKQLGQETQDARNYAESIINTVREPLIVPDADLRVISASRSFYQIFKVKLEKTEKKLIYDLGNRQ